MTSHVSGIPETWSIKGTAKKHTTVAAGQIRPTVWLILDRLPCTVSCARRSAARGLSQRAPAMAYAVPSHRSAPPNGNSAKKISDLVRGHLKAGLDSAGVYWIRRIFDKNLIT
jgi:hypothetical protein